MLSTYYSKNSGFSKLCNIYFSQLPLLPFQVATSPEKMIFFESSTKIWPVYLFYLPQNLISSF